jgi:hypothetical protein
MERLLEPTLSAFADGYSSIRKARAMSAMVMVCLWAALSPNSTPAAREFKELEQGAKPEFVGGDRLRWALGPYKTYLISLTKPGA